MENVLLKCRWCFKEKPINEMFISKEYIGKKYPSQTCIKCKNNHIAHKIELRQKRRADFISRWNKEFSLA